MKYEPFINDRLGIAGIKCTRDNGDVCTIYLNPSDNEDEAESDVFLYIGGINPDPALDWADCFIVPVFQEDIFEELDKTK